MNNYIIGVTGKVFDQDGNDVGYCRYANSQNDIRVFHRSPINKCEIGYIRSGLTLILNNGSRLKGYIDSVPGLINAKAFELKYGIPGRILTVK